MKHFFLPLLILLPGLCLADQRLANLIQMLDYVGVDYPGAVARGEIIDAAEYHEMQGFAAAIADQSAGLPLSPASAKLRTQASDLARKIERHAPADQIAALTSLMRNAVVTHYHVPVVPRQPPDLDLASRLFAQNCAACHGSEGRGDGAQAARLEPPPTNFHDRARYLHRTLYGLYNTVTLGVEGTAMPGFENLSEHQRWSLAFYVGQLAANQAVIARGAQLSKHNSIPPALTDIQSFTTTTPAEVETKASDGAALMAYLRAHPAQLFSQREKPLVYTRRQLAQSFVRYREQNKDAAYRAAVTAYMDGFELVESSLDTVASDLRVTIEEAMTHYRNLLRGGAPVEAVQQQLHRLYGLLDQAQQQLSSTTLGGGAVFSAALIILLREGLEALLVVAALAAFLVKTGRRDGLAYLHVGWVGALLLGFVTWMASVYVIDISGAGREMTEGIASLLAAGILFYVGFWMHNKTHARQWQRFIEGNVKKVLTRGSLWGLAGLSFIAVYREVFETILFYQALWMQTTTTGYSMVLVGMGVAAVALVIAAWLILRYSVRIPLRQFFAVSGIFMFVLALVLAGKGMAALQEAGTLPASPIAFPRIEILGVYPSAQGLIVQLAMVLLGIVLIWGGNARRTTTEKPANAAARRITDGN